MVKRVVIIICIKLLEISFGWAGYMRKEKAAAAKFGTARRVKSMLTHNELTQRERIALVDRWIKLSNEKAARMVKKCRSIEEAVVLFKESPRYSKAESLYLKLIADLFCEKYKC